MIPAGWYETFGGESVGESRQSNYSDFPLKTITLQLPKGLSLPIPYTFALCSADKVKCAHIWIDPHPHYNCLRFNGQSRRRRIYGNWWAIKLSVWCAVIMWSPLGAWLVFRRKYITDTVLHFIAHDEDKVENGVPERNRWTGWPEVKMHPKKTL